MKILTKEWIKDIDLGLLISMYDGRGERKIPLVFTGDTAGIAKDDLLTVKTNFDMTEKENKISFVMVPDTFGFSEGYSDIDNLEIKTSEDEFLSKYTNRLRVISYLPEEILKSVKDKRLLALGYAEEEVKKSIVGYCRDKYEKAFKEYEESCENTVNVTQGLNIQSCIFKQKNLQSLAYLFDDAVITEVKISDNKILITIDDDETVILTGASVLEEEVSPVSAYVNAIELYNEDNGYEMHLLVRKRDENFVDNYYYVTYGFKKMKLKTYI